mmetsp:Transcript_36317/g.82801  ORF Transcript_36317/g.82801 Transcript_36317/m.82801 type:complete len:244 (+) Transcript_36317:3231-3962(+)
MFATISAARFLMSAPRSLRPRCTMGTRRASDGASTAFTKVVDTTTSSAIAVCPLGSSRANRSCGARERISGLRMTDPTCCRATLAPSRTLMWESVSVVASVGTMVGRQLPSWRGAQYAIAPSSSTLAALVRHARSSRPFSSAGMTSLTPCPLSCAITALAAPSAASRTAVCVSPQQLSSSGRMWITYGSNSLPSVSDRHSNAKSAPSRRRSDFLSPHALCSSFITSNCFSAEMPRPFTTPPRP